MGTRNDREAGRAPNGDDPKYLKIAKRFEHQLRTGVLRVGDRLPSLRTLRDEHRVSAATAIGCYLWLERQGYIRSRPKSGFFVSRAPAPDGPPPTVSRRTKGPVVVNLSRLGPALRPAARDVVDLGPAVVSSALLPMKRLNRSTRIALSAFADNAVRYEDPRGNLRLRRQIARLLFRQGATCSPDELVVTSGQTEALNLSVRAVAKPGDVVAVESPGCYEILHALEAYRMKAVAIPHVLRQGIDLEALAAAARKYRVKAILMTATCHNALGDCASDSTKAEVVSFATERGIPIVEGDPFGDLIFEGERPRPLKAFDREGIVLHCSSLAHYVAPGFNLGWVAGGRFHAEIERLKGFTNVAAARLPQLALAEFLESGAYDKHVKELRSVLSQLVERSREEILRLFPGGTRVSRPEGGFVLWVQLPMGTDGLELSRKAAALGVNILPGAAFSPSPDYRTCIRIACGHPFEVLKPAIGALASLLRR